MYINYNTEIFKSANRIKLTVSCVGHAIVGKEWQGYLATPVYSRLYYVISGSFMITLSNGTEYVFEKGKWYLLPSCISCHFECPDSMEHIYFHLKLCEYDGTDLLRCCTSPLSLDGECPLDFIKESINTSSVTTALRLKNIASDVISLMIDENDVELHGREYSPCIIKAIQYIRQNLSASLTIGEISENIFVSKSTLTKHFSRELSMSVNEYVTSLVMSEAEALLSSTTLSVNAVSEKLGFNDQLYFSRRFKQKFGVSPSEYRKNRCYLFG